jgi:hypothetical protein
MDRQRIRVVLCRVGCWGIQVISWFGWDVGRYVWYMLEHFGVVMLGPGRYKMGGHIEVAPEGLFLARTDVIQKGVREGLPIKVKWN